ncbi:MAG: hypothetical protein Q8R70_08280, partial [Methanoregula sp.]|nr:hypothetical protein [Methanoregula sp.]
ADETVALMEGFAEVAPDTAGEVVVTVVAEATAAETGSTSNAARSTIAINAIPKDTDFFIKEFFGSYYY